MHSFGDINIINVRMKTIDNGDIYNQDLLKLSYDLVKVSLTSFIRPNRSALREKT